MPFLKLKTAKGLLAGEWNLAGVSLSFGHGMSVDVPIDDPKMSRQHFRISAQADGYVLQDLGSKHGTFVNDVRVTEAKLKPKDRIQAGDSQFFFIEGYQTIVHSLEYEDHQAAVDKLTDQAALAKLAVESDDRKVRSAAVAKLTDPTVLARMGMWVKPELTQQLTEPALLAEIALKAKDWAVRQVAVMKLTDQTRLAQIAVEDLEPMVRGVAVEKIADQALLAKIALTDKEWEVRRVAVDTIADPALLAKVAAESKDPDIRGAAAARIKPPA